MLTYHKNSEPNFYKSIPKTYMRITCYHVESCGWHFTYQRIGIALDTYRLTRNYLVDLIINALKLTLRFIISIQHGFLFAQVKRSKGMFIMQDVAISKSEFISGQKAVTKLQEFQNDEVLFQYCKNEKVTLPKSVLV